MSSSNLTHRNTFSNSRGRWLPLAAGIFIFAGLAGTLWALSSAWGSDSDKDGWSDEEEILAGTNPFDETEPWDSDGDGIADYLEFLNGTDPLDAGDPPKTSLAGSAVGVASLSQNRSGTEITSAETTLLPQPTITPAEPFPANASKGKLPRRSAWRVELRPVRDLKEFMN